MKIKKEMKQNLRISVHKGIEN